MKFISNACKRLSRKRQNVRENVGHFSWSIEFIHTSNTTKTKDRQSSDIYVQHCKGFNNKTTNNDKPYCIESQACGRT